VLAYASIIASKMLRSFSLFGRRRSGASIDYYSFFEKLEEQTHTDFFKNEYNGGNGDRRL